MINKIIETSLKQRFLVVVFGIGIVIYGIHSTLALNVDAFPDVTNIQVQIFTAASGLAAEEVEKLITFPIESVMNGLPSSRTMWTHISLDSLCWSGSRSRGNAFPRTWATPR